MRVSVRSSPSYLKCVIFYQFCSLFYVISMIFLLCKKKSNMILPRFEDAHRALKTSIFIIHKILEILSQLRVSCWPSALLDRLDWKFLFGSPSYHAIQELRSLMSPPAHTYCTQHSFLPQNKIKFCSVWSWNQLKSTSCGQQQTDKILQLRHFI